jgi:hypothetical protein
MFVGWVVTYQTVARIISLPKVYLSLTSTHAVTFAYFCSESRNTDPSRLYDTTDLKATDTDDSASPATGRCIAHVY